MECSLTEGAKGHLGEDGNIEMDHIILRLETTHDIRVLARTQGCVEDHCMLTCAPDQNIRTEPPRKLVVAGKPHELIVPGKAKKSV